jgi:hypothetical protein
MMSGAGNWIRVQGSGSFDPAAHTVAAKGAMRAAGCRSW